MLQERLFLYQGSISKGVMSYDNLHGMNSIFLIRRLQGENLWQIPSMSKFYVFSRIQ